MRPRNLQSNRLPGKADAACLRTTTFTIFQVGPRVLEAGLASLDALSQSWETPGLCIRHCFLAASLC